ncbi:MAG: SusC/RagA family TonB-linked outer membrane protein [Flavitalea sp.]
MRNKNLTNLKRGTRLVVLALVLQLGQAGSGYASDNGINNTNHLRKIITGKVTDENGKPVEGATVKVKDAKSGTTTNATGAFSLNAPDNATIVISSVGFETKEVTASEDIVIMLKHSEETMADAVVVGYSSKKAKYLSSSVSVVSGDKLRDVTSNELSSLLQGKAPGVVVSTGSGDPTSGSNILVRGAGTISAGSGPLIVVDGNIGGTYNPTDVESITVLKDAAATGLYGSRAGNGVIIVTTKTGKSGKTKIDFNSIVGVNRATTGNFKLMNSQQLFDYQSTFYTPDPAALNTNTDWWDLAFRDALTQSYTLSASGGNDRTQFYVSGNYYQEQGTLDKNDKTQYNFRTNLSHKLTDKLKLSVLFNGIYTKDNYNPAGTLYQAYTNMPWDSAYNADGTPRDAREGNWYGRDRNNFLHSLQYDLSNAVSNRVNGDINLDYQISKHFSFATYNRGTFTNLRSTSFYDKRSKSGATNGGELYNSSSYSSLLTSSNRFRYDNSFGDHNLSVLAVGEVTQSYYDVLSTAVKGLPPGRPFASTATDVLENPAGGRNEYSFQKYLAQADYNFANKYFLVASFVRDRSSRFGNNNSTANFYQLGASWVLSNEDFMRSIPAISFLKLRASYGTTGNAEIGDYGALGLYTISQAASYANAPGASPSQKGNPDLTWEKQKTANVGVDIGLFKRIDISVDIYEKNATDLLYQKPLPATTGYSFVWENIGSVRNRGLELNITSRNFVSKNFNWETNLNMAFNRNKVIALNDGALFSSPGASQPIGVGHDMDEWNMPVWAGVDPANGDPLWEKVMKDADGKSYITYTNDYNSAATEVSRQYTGKSAAPKFTGGFTNTISYKGFSLSAFFNFVYGNWVYNDTRFYFDNDGVYEKYNSMVLPSNWTRWEKPGDIATHPKPYFGGNKSSNQTSTRYLEDGSYVRLRNVTVGYDLPVNFINRVKLSRARIYLSGDNLWTGTKFTGPDPEVVLSSGTSSFRYPLSRKLLVGVNLSF